MGDVALPQIDSPFQVQAKGLQLRALMNAGQDAQYQQQQRAQAQTDDASYRAAMQANPGGGAGLLKDLARTGSPKDYAAAVKADLEARKGQATIDQSGATAQAAKLKALNEAFTLHRDQINLVNDPTTAAQWVAAAYQDPTLGPLVSQTGSVESAVARIPQDPAGFAQWKQQASLNAEQYVKHTSVDAKTKATNDRIASEGALNRGNAIKVQDMIGERQDAKGTTLLHGIKGLTAESNDALTKAVAEGRLDPNRINSRTASLYGDMALKNPTLDFSKISADIALGRNAAFQQKAMTASTMPEIMDNMVTAGKKVGFSDVRTVGKMQAWAKGEFNDPDYTDYMNQRNDALLGIAGVMRANGMTDMAHKAELEAAAITMSPQALDGWMRGQMRSLAPRLKNNARIMHTDIHGTTIPQGGTAVPGAVPGTGTGSPAPAPGVPARPIDSFFIKAP